MKRLFSPVVWLCAVGAIALGALTVYDPNGVYAGYISALDSNTPVIAAVFTAAQDGVYPWSSAPAEDVLPRSPAYHPLTETVTDEEMRSSVGNNEPFQAQSPGPQPIEDSTAPVEVTPSVEIVRHEPVEDPAAQDGETVSNDPAAGFVTVDKSWFDDALFIGDSHTEGLCDYAGIPNATFYYKRGLDIWSVMKKAFVGGKQTIPQALSQRKFGKIYIMLGINEIGVGTAESFSAQYASVISQLRELQPDALIYIQAIFHTSQKKSATSAYNNDAINARNIAISTIADGEHIFFIDCNAVFDDESGALTPAYSGDGVHVKAPYYTMWRDYLLRFGRAGIASVEPPEEIVQPVEPVKPVEPVQPVKPVEPEQSAETSEPAAPAAPAESAEAPKPTETAAPIEPAPEPAPEASEAPAPEASEEAVPEGNSESAPDSVEALPEAEASPEPESADMSVGEASDEKISESD